MAKKSRRWGTFFILLIIIIIAIMIYLKIDWFWRFVYPLEYGDIILSNANKYDLDPFLVAGIIYVESKFVPTARSHRGALGLMQIMPETGNWIAEKLSISDFKEDKLLIPEINIMFGCWYLADLKKQFGQEIIIVLAAYNAGRGNVKKWFNDKDWDGNENSIDELPFKETENYIKLVLKVSEKYRKIYNFQQP